MNKCAISPTTMKKKKTKAVNPISVIINRTVFKVPFFLSISFRINLVSIREI